MHARSRILSALLSGAMVGGLLPAAAAANELVPGRPGRFELSSITIDATTGDCRATYESPAAGNLWMRGVDASVRVQASPNGVHVTCRFTDMSHLIEINAEVGYTDACEVVTETKTLTGGWGIATSAANISERAEGGNSFVMCRFKSETAPTAQRSATASVAAEAGERSGPAESRERRRRPATTGSDRLPRDTAPKVRPASRQSSTKMASAKVKASNVATNSGKATRATGGSRNGIRADSADRRR